MCTIIRTWSSSFPGNEPQRFVANYRKAGGEIELVYIEMERHKGHTPDLSQIGGAFADMVKFVGRHIKDLPRGQIAEACGSIRRMTPSR